MAFKATGPGRVSVQLDKSRGVLVVWLSNFDVDGADVKIEHDKVLRDSVAPIVQNGGNIDIMGLASTTGTTKHNHQLAIARMDAVLGSLRVMAGNFRVTRYSPWGEIMPLAFKEGEAQHRPGVVGGTDDNVESVDWRGVVLNASNGRRLPPAPATKAIKPPTAAPSEWADTSGKVLDVANNALGFVDLAGEIGLLSLAPATATAIAAGGLALGVVGGMLQFPLMFASADERARWNGSVQGMADALQDCVDQFADNRFEVLPISQWPPIKVPEIHAADSATPTASQIAWRTGQHEGLKRMMDHIVEMENNPRVADADMSQGVKISGRVWLRLVQKIHGANAGVKLVIEPVNEELRGKGKKPWPTT